MSSIDRLLSNYARQVRLPWSAHTSGKQRVWFAVYPPAEERRVRARLPQFEGSRWKPTTAGLTVDLTDLLPKWIAVMSIARESLPNPSTSAPAANSKIWPLNGFVTAACSEDANATCVVAITGLATLFDFMRVSSLIERVEDSVRGRLLVFFPGEYAGNVYRFMDARDGFNYMAVPITSTESFIPHDQPPVLLP
jgi:hypothetical protein